MTEPGACKPGRGSSTALSQEQTLLHASTSSGHSCEATECPRKGFGQQPGKEADTQSLEASGARWSRGTLRRPRSWRSLPCPAPLGMAAGLHGAPRGSSPAAGVPQRVHSYLAWREQEHRAAPHPRGLPGGAAPVSRVVSHCVKCHLGPRPGSLRGFCGFQNYQHREPKQTPVAPAGTTFCTTTNQRETVGETGSARALQDGPFLGLKVPENTTVSMPPPPLGGRGLAQVLRPTCQRAAACCRTHPGAYFRPEQREQTGSAGHYDTHLAPPLRAALPCRQVPGTP